MVEVISCSDSHPLALTVNAVLTFLAFLVSIPGIVSTRNRFFFRLQSLLLISTALLTLVVGLIIWFSTLKTRSSLGTLWALQTSDEQKLLQQRFQCCGYINSTFPPFQIDDVCPDAKTAATKPGCVGPFSGFANSYLDILFTTLFGIVAVDGFAFLAGVVVLKDRAEKKRYRMIDEKGGCGGI